MNSKGVRLNGYSISSNIKGHKLYRGGRDHYGEWHESSLGYIKETTTTQNGPANIISWVLMNGEKYYYVDIDESLFLK